MSTANASRAVIAARNLVNLDSSELFYELRAIIDVQERRETTQHVYDMRMRIFSKKPTYRSSMAHHLVEEVHPMFRNGFERVLNGSSEGKVKIAQFAEINLGLHHHHGAEDEQLFPQLRKQFPKIGSELDVLENDHANLVKLEKDIKSGSYTALVEFVAALNDHLNREEMLLVPCLL
jgi:hemerythrin-like domain-containing protein